MMPKKQENQAEEAKLIRILATDIPGNKSVYVGLTRIKGISWSMANAVCRILNLDKNIKMANLEKDTIGKITSFLKSPKLPSFLLNRRKDLETGDSTHLVSSDLDLKREFDIKRLKKIKTYRGLRHSLGQPVRGQRTRSHFRKNKAVGVRKKRGSAK